MADGIESAEREYVGDSLTGGYTGAEKRTIARACTGGADTITLFFARRAGRVMSGVMPEPDGCYVDVAVPKSADPDPNGRHRRLGWTSWLDARWGSHVDARRRVHDQSPRLVPRVERRSTVRRVRRARAWK